MTARDYHASWGLKYGSVGLLCNVVALGLGRTRGGLVLLIIGMVLTLLGIRHCRLAK